MNTTITTGSNKFEVTKGNTGVMVYIDYMQQTYTPQVIEDAIKDTPVSFVIDTTERINNPGVKFTYKSIIQNLKDGELSKCIYRSLGGVYPKNHNVSFKTVIIGTDRYDLTISNEV